CAMPAKHLMGALGYNVSVRLAFGQARRFFYAGPGMDEYGEVYAALRRGDSFGHSGSGKWSRWEDGPRGVEGGSRSPGYRIGSGGRSYHCGCGHRRIGWGWKTRD